MTADRIDSQTAFGKVPAGGERTHTLGMPCFAIADGKGRWVGERGKEKSRAFFERGKVGPTTVVSLCLHYSIIID